ncbi:ribonuclease R [uncultured Abyssibacter sp.]|uniref:ribonuclease R n=1 Tax=uncultured Abyssibacter sp. TaxID=2320202 RepID=UPI0032B194CD
MSKKQRKKGWAAADPAFEREQQRYASPVPSRQFILETLTEHGRPMSRNSLLRHFGLAEDDEAQTGLSHRIGAMIRDGQLVENRRGALGLPKRMDLVPGRVIGHRDGFGFLQPDAGGDDIFLSPREMRRLLHGDRALVRITGEDRRGRKEGSVVEVLERGNDTVVGRLMIERGVCFVVPDNSRIAQDIMISPDDLNGACHGQIVTVELIEQPSRGGKPIGRVKELLGDHMAPGMEIDIAVRSHGIPYEWPEAVDEQIAGLSAEVAESDKAGREDLRDLPLVTIDGADARDFDDAVYAKPTRGGWKLYVAIADVSAYVQPGTPLDQEAYKRGNSVYFPERVIPMLPEILSNGLCSLNPHVDRLCMVCEMQVGKNGEVKRGRFYEAVMRSQARLTYDEVAELLANEAAATRGERAKLMPHLTALHALYEALRDARDSRGAIDFESSETRIIFGRDRKIERVVPVVRNVAHKMIEECMIAANVQAARALESAKQPTLYRVHEQPPGDRLEDLRAFLAEWGLGVGGGQKPEAQHFSRLLEEVAGRPDARLIQTVLLRSMAQAVYQPENQGHFGLALERYAHFTSPIRRYPDLIVHRGLKRLCKGTTTGAHDYSTEEMTQAGAHCSGTERRADEATRDVMDWLKCEFMLDRVGDVFEGLIVGVTSFGLFIELDDLAVTGLVHVSQLRNDYYHFESKYHRLRGERTGRMYRLSDRMAVKVVRVDLDERKIDFEPVEGRSGKTRS